jgi:YfiH family protein
VPFKQVGSLRLYQFESLDHSGLIHAVFTRRGGASKGCWRSLNVGATVGDDPEHVRENRRRLLECLGRKPESVYEVWQVHSAHVIVVDGPRGEAAIEKADAMVTDDARVTLLMRFADCVPILVYDSVRHAVGIAHAGWLGTTRKVAAELVKTMKRRYGCDPANMHAAIGPSIAAHHYEVGPEVEQAIQRAFGSQARQHLWKRNGRIHLDLWSANRALLESEGVNQIEISGLCSACAPEDWYSHRGESGRTGRFGLGVALRHGD